MCQTVWIQIRPDVLIWVQTVCKGYQQMTKVATSGESVMTQICNIDSGTLKGATYFTEFMNTVGH